MMTTVERLDQSFKKQRHLQQFILQYNTMLLEGNINRSKYKCLNASMWVRKKKLKNNECWKSTRKNGEKLGQEHLSHCFYNI